MVSLNKKIKVGQRAVISWYGLFVVRLGIAVDDIISSISHFRGKTAISEEKKRIYCENKPVALHVLEISGEVCVCVRSNVSLKLKIKRIKQHVALDFF